MNLTVTMDADPDEQKVYWNGLSRAAEFLMEDFDYKAQIQYPIVSLNSMLMQQRERVEGLRPHDEIAQNVSRAVSILKRNPFVDFTDMNELVGEGGFGEVKKIQRKNDQKIFVLKDAFTTTKKERQVIINEASLIAFLDSDEMVKCIALYDWRKKFYIVLEYMEQEFTSIVRTQNEQYSEDFCRWSLYKVCKGLFLMHEKGVLHRDVKSDNVLCNANGDIKLCDLGCATIISEQIQ